MLDTLVFF